MQSMCNCQGVGCTGVSFNGTYFVLPGPVTCKSVGLLRNWVLQALCVYGAGVLAECSVTSEGGAAGAECIRKPKLGLTCFVELVDESTRVSRVELQLLDHILQGSQHSTEQHGPP